MFLQWSTSTEQVFKEALANEATTYCSAYLADCSLLELVALARHVFIVWKTSFISFISRSVNFTVDAMEVLSLEDTGFSLEFLVVLHPPFTTSPLPQAAAANVLLSVASSIYQTAGKILSNISPYTLPPSILPVVILPMSETPTAAVPLPLLTPTPSPLPPSLQERQDHAVLLVLSYTSMEQVTIRVKLASHAVHHDGGNLVILQWYVQVEQLFKLTVAEQATQYCGTNPPACGLQSGNKRR